MTRLALLCLIPLFTLACGDKDDDTGSDEADADTDTDTDTDTDIDCSTDAWADQTSDTKGAWMAACVMPDMTTVFQSFDSTEFADFSCASCHGADFNGGTYGMPNGPTLNFDESDSWPEGYYDFMAGEVGPTMAGILGYQPYDGETGEGFGCAGCHTFTE